MAANALIRPTGPASLAGAVRAPRSAPAAAEGGLSTFRALRHRNYRLYFFGQMVSVTGSWVQNAALPWLAFHLTETSRWPALVMAAQLAPALLLGAWGGVLADRYPKRSILLGTQIALMVLALSLAGLTALGLATVWHLLLIASAVGVVNALDLPARLAFVIEMTGRDDLMNAVGLNSLMFNVARVLGPAIGVWLLPFGPELCFLLNGFSYLAILTGLLLMRGLQPPAPAEESAGLLELLRGGFGYVASHRTLSLLLLLVSAVALCGWPILVLLPALSESHLRGGERGYSWMLSALGAGALTAALLVASFGTMARRRWFIGGGVVIASAGLFVLSFAPNLASALVCCALVGLGLVLFFSTSQATVQLSAGDHNRGRVMGIYSIVLSGATPLGSLMAGPAADNWSVVSVLRVQGLAIFAAAGLIVVLLRLRLRRGSLPQS